MKSFVGLCCVALLSYGVYSQFIQKDSPAVTGSVSAVRSLPLPDDPRSALNVIKIDWRRDGFGLAAVVDVALKNNNGYTVRVDQIACRFRDNASGKIEEHSQGVYDVVPAHGEKIVKNVGLGFVDAELRGVGCSVTKAQKS